VFTLHATKKLLDRLGSPDSATAAPSTTALGNWYATALFWRPQVALFVNEPTLVPVLVPLAPTATLVERFPAELAEVLMALGTAREFIDNELAEMGQCHLAKTASRSVLGTMNEFASLAKFGKDDERIDGLVALSVDLAHTPCGALRKGHDFPDLELRALVTASRR
jgi:hypothetical protein